MYFYFHLDFKYDIDAMQMTIKSTIKGLWQEIVNKSYEIVVNRCWKRIQVNEITRMTDQLGTQWPTSIAGFTDRVWGRMLNRHSVFVMIQTERQTAITELLFDCTHQWPLDLYTTWSQMRRIHVCVNKWCSGCTSVHLKTCFIGCDVVVIYFVYFYKFIFVCVTSFQFHLLLSCFLRIRVWCHVYLIWLAYRWQEHWCTTSDLSNKT